MENADAMNIQKSFIQTWDGRLPSTMLGDNPTSLLNINAQKG